MYASNQFYTQHKTNRSKLSFSLVYPNQCITSVQEMIVSIFIQYKTLLLSNKEKKKTCTAQTIHSMNANFYVHIRCSIKVTGEERQPLDLGMATLSVIAH